MCSTHKYLCGAARAGRYTSNKKMNIPKLTHESGVINLGKQFVSLRLLKEALEKENKIKVLEEESTFIRCQVQRIKHNYGGSAFLCPTIILKVETHNYDTRVIYDFFWPDYYITAFIVLVFTIGSILPIIEANIQYHAGALSIFFLMVFGVAGLWTFWETRRCSKRLRKTLKEI